MTESNSKVMAKAMQSKTEIFIQKAIKVHGEKYKYPKTIFTRSTDKVEILCVACNAFFEQRAYAHLGGGGCDKCARKAKADKRRFTKEQFIERAESVHGCGHYDYSMVDYIRSFVPVEIRCTIHNYTFKQKPNCHLMGQGCAKCGGSERLTTESFVARAKEIHADLDYDYSKVIYINSHTKVMVLCAQHGEFKVTPNAILSSKKKCPKCNKEDVRDKSRVPFDVFRKRSVATHRDKYAYDEKSYICITKKARVFCKTHGWFWQLPTDHIEGHGCKKCSMALHGFGRENFINICAKNKRSAFLYVVKCTNDSEMFYKVGITSQSITERFYGKAMPYNYEILHSITGDAGFIYDFETQMHRLLREHRYQPKIKFKGDKFECFSTITKPMQKLLAQMQKSKQIQLVA